MLAHSQLPRPHLHAVDNGCWRTANIPDRPPTHIHPALTSPAACKPGRTYFPQIHSCPFRSLRQLPLSATTSVTCDKPGRPAACENHDFPNNDNICWRTANFPGRTANFPDRICMPGTTFAGVQPTSQTAFACQGQRLLACSQLPRPQLMFYVTY